MNHSEPEASGKDQEPNLVLIGYRATGKTSVGARLSRMLGRPLVDLDEVLVQEAGRSIAEMVAQGGWEEFRRREKELTRRFGKAGGQILATGGGVILDPENVAALKEHGIIVWLKAEPAVIQARLGHDDATAANRPSLTGSDTLAEVENVLAVRETLYRGAAQVVVDTTDLSILEVVERILSAVKSLGISFKN
jgi:shikimate kinase